MFAYLADLKIGANFSSLQAGISVEGLMTTGSKNSYDQSNGNKVLGKRASFNSPVAASYLLTVATNDGVDDAAGTPKQSLIGNLNLDEGLQVLIISANKSISEKFSGFVRYGVLQSRADSIRGTRGIGSEIDLGAMYQLTSSAALISDYGNFFPGNYYANRGRADLFSLKYKYSF